jgi:hypothetical protein
MPTQPPTCSRGESAPLGERPTLHAPQFLRPACVTTGYPAANSLPKIRVSQGGDGRMQHHQSATGRARLCHSRGTTDSEREREREREGNRSASRTFRFADAGLNIATRTPKLCAGVGRRHYHGSGRAQGNIAEYFAPHRWQRSGRSLQTFERELRARCVSIMSTSLHHSR